MIYRTLCKKRTNISFFYRFYATKKGVNLWAEDVNTEIKIAIEKYWKDYVLKEYKKHNGKSFYVLSMFPYPSGNLHMGHVRVYSISDTVARFQNMIGNDVIHPMGWDAFGLPAENAAIVHKIPPQQWTESNIKTMKQQLLELGYNFDWTKEFSTCNPDYYKWTQYIFLRLLSEGLAYQKKASVNWDPIDKTVLADEQVDEFGHSWRSGAKVEKKILTQWFIRTTKFAKQLYDGLNDKILENWRDIINLQQHWIGLCDGVTVTFVIENKSKEKCQHLDVWTSEPYKFIHGDFITVSKENIMAIEHMEKCKDKKLPVSAYNPVADKCLPIYLNDSSPYPDGRDVYLGCYSTCEEDMELALKLGIHVENTNLNLNNQKDSNMAIEIAQKKGVGGYFTSSKLKDWLISRQRYWGTPIPIIHCDSCGVVPVPYTNLPVQLPEGELTGSGINTLKTLETWINCICPLCKKSAKRETDTMDTFVDSSWYYYRYLDPKNINKPFDSNKVNGITPVDIYIGGKEHAVLHLYYARFMSYFFHHLGWTSIAEPFRRLIVQGMVMGKTYKVKSTGKYISENEVIALGQDYKEKESGEKVEASWEKMSKSKFNGESPERLVNTYGCDTTRLFMLADVSPPTARRWSDATFPGVLNWQHRLWITLRDFITHRSNDDLCNTRTLPEDEFNKYEYKLWQSRNYYTSQTIFTFQHTHQLSVGISRLQGLTSTLRNKIPNEVIARSSEYEKALASVIIMLAPAAPHFSSELWAGFLSATNRVNVQTPLIDWHSDVLDQNFPKVDDHFELSLLCNVDGADKCELKIKAIELNKFTHEDALQLMLKQESVNKRIKKGISDSQFKLFPGCRGILYITTNRNVKPKPEKLLITN